MSGGSGGARSLWAEFLEPAILLQLRKIGRKFKTAENEYIRPFEVKLGRKVVGSYEEDTGIPAMVIHARRRVRHAGSTDSHPLKIRL